MEFAGANLANNLKFDAFIKFKNCAAFLIIPHLRTGSIVRGYVC